MKHFLISLTDAANNVALNQLLSQAEAITKADVLTQLSAMILNVEALRLIGCDVTNLNLLKISSIGTKWHLRLKKPQCARMLDHIGVGGVDEEKMITEYILESLKDIDKDATVLSDKGKILINSLKKNSLAIQATYVR